MRVILLQDVENLGKKYDVMEVKNGYARNFLIPQKLAKIATKKGLEWVKNQKELKMKKAEEELKNVQEIASKFDGVEITIPVKLGAEGQLFESINKQKISEELKKAGFEVKKMQIELEKPIKEAGEFPIKIKLEHNLEIEIKVIVVEEK